jgi:hypothetical protein
MSDTYPVYGGQRATLAQIQARDTFQRLHPTLQQRVSEMIVGSGGTVGFGEGFRSEETQKQMFLSRYVLDPNGKVRWNNQRWTHAKGATAAPPGRSMHELGLAADLVGDMAWVVANANRFALNHFARVNDEPWHVQPFELPNSRRQYEQIGSPWKGTTPATPGPAPKTEPGTAGDDQPDIPPSVTPGMRGPVVGQLQDVMIRRGLIADTPGNRDEFYGDGTQKVIRQFQADHGLVVDAKVGPKTWGALLDFD